MNTTDTQQRTQQRTQQWNSLNGKAQVVSVVIVAGQERLVIKYENLELPELINPVEFDARVENDEKRFESRVLATVKSEGSNPIQKSDGFVEQFPPMQRAKVLATLSKSVRNGGNFLSREDLIKQMVADGATITVVAGEKALQRPSGSYIEQSRLTKTGMDYAEYLISAKILG